MPLPREIRRLMTQIVQWESVASRDGHGDETYAAAVGLACHVEMNVDADRLPDENRAVPRQDLYFDGGDERVQSFTLSDRFTVPGVGGGQRLQAKSIDTVYGPPPGDSWLVKVTVG